MLLFAEDQLLILDFALQLHSLDKRLAASLLDVSYHQLLFGSCGVTLQLCVSHVHVNCTFQVEHEAHCNHMRFVHIVV